jgi:hypothetical protein
MPFDAARAWVELGAYIASKPNHGRQDLLSECARIAERNMVAEDDMDRALRLALPPLADMMFNRRPAREQEPQATATPVPVEPREGEADWVQHAGADRPAIAAV